MTVAQVYSPWTSYPERRSGLIFLIQLPKPVLTDEKKMAKKKKRAAIKPPDVVRPEEERAQSPSINALEEYLRVS